MRAHKKRLATITLVAASLAVPHAAHAEPANPKAAARSLAEKGYALYEAGKYQEAITDLAEADRLYHAPTLVFALGRAHDKIGKLVEALALYKRVADEHLPASASPAFRDAQRMAKEEVATIQRRIPSIQIVVQGRAGRSVQVAVDGLRVRGFMEGRAIPANPGLRKVTVAPEGESGVTRTVDLREGLEARVEVELPPPAGGAAPPPPPPPSRGWLVPSIVGFSVGAVGLGLGIGAGAAALQRDSSIRKDCGGTSCPTSEASKLSAAKALANASTAGFVIAGAGVVTGVLLVVVKPGSTPAPAEVGVAVGPLSLGVEGRF